MSLKPTSTNMHITASTAGAGQLKALFHQEAVKNQLHPCCVLCCFGFSEWSHLWLVNKPIHGVCVQPPHGCQDTEKIQ